jgi:hypothetical protein
MVMLAPKPVDLLNDHVDLVNDLWEQQGALCRVRMPHPREQCVRLHIGAPRAHVGCRPNMHETVFRSYQHATELQQRTYPADMK